MNLSLSKKYRRQQGAFRTLLFKNPVLVLGLDLPFVIACATSLKNAVALSMEMFIIHIATMVAAMITVRFFPRWSRMLVNVGVSTIVMTLARHLITGIFPDLTNRVGMYVYLMAVNGMTIYEAAQLTKQGKPLPVLGRAFMNALAFSLTMLLVSLLREYFGNGTLWGVIFPVPVKLSGLLLPFGGFIIMGLLLAFANFFNKKLLAFSISESIRRDAHYTEIVPRPLPQDHAEPAEPTEPAEPAAPATDV